MVFYLIAILCIASLIAVTKRVGLCRLGIAHSPSGYFWKCWRGLPLSYLFLLLLALAWSVFVAWYCVRSTNENDTLMDAWNAAASNVGTLLGFMAAFAGIAIGAGSIGDELASGTAQFLFVRPYTRRHFNWVAWTAGALQTAIFSLISVLGLLITLTLASGGIKTWLPCWLFPVVWITGLLGFGITSLLVVATRNSKQGIVMGLGICLGYQCVWELLKTFEITIPSPSWLYIKPWVRTMATVTTTTQTSTGYSTHSHSWSHIAASSAPLPVWGMMGWLLLALVLPIIQQYFIDKSDV